MKLDELVDKLLSSKIIENQELATTLMTSPEMPQEEKKRHIEKFKEDYTSGKIDFDDEEKKNLINTWIELYQSVEHELIKENRVKRIE